MTARLLTINTGSSSLKVAVYRIDSDERLELAAQANRIGLSGGRLRIRDAQGTTLLDQHGDLSSHDAALEAFFDWLRREDRDDSLAAVGHRIVHGGSRYSEPQLITDDLIAALLDLVVIDPMHLPQAISAIEVTSRTYPSVPQVACFDTAFHRRMPFVAQSYPLPRSVRDDGVIRYGFHGLSYEYIMQKLRAEDSAAADGRVIIAHLGNGASMVAVRNGVGIDTTMGFTPSGGLMMGTRAGDLDPGVLLFLLQAKGKSADEVNDLVNRKSGLLGVSEVSADVHDLLDREATNPRAAEALALFCYQAKKYLGALAAALDGLDTLIFTGGIGENATSIRDRICTGLDFLGIQLDPERNAASAPIISVEGSQVTVRVMKTDEDLMIARHTYRLVVKEGH